MLTRKVIRRMGKRIFRAKNCKGTFIKYRICELTSVGTVRIAIGNADQLLIVIIELYFTPVNQKTLVILRKTHMMMIAPRQQHLYLHIRDDKSRRSIQIPYSKYACFKHCIYFDLCSYIHL